MGRIVTGRQGVRNYKRKRPRQWRDKDKRMRAAVRMRGEGMSLRQSAKELAVSYQTVSNDLARWDAQQASAPANVVSLSRKVSRSGVKSDPPGGRDLTPEIDTRTTGEVLGLTAKEEAMARAIASMANQGR